MLGKRGEEDMIALTKFICSQVQFGNTKRLHLQMKVSLRLFYFLQIVNIQSIFGLVLSFGGVLPIVLFGIGMSFMLVRLSCNKKIEIALSKNVCIHENAKVEWH